jgi:hypothetical protein
LSELRVHLNDEDDRETAVELIRRLRSRGDITESVGREIDALLSSLPAAKSKESWGAPGLDDAETTSARSGGTEAGSGSSGTPEVSRGAPATGAEWRADPYRRYEQRFWNGTEWTDHVSTGGRQMTDPPGDRPAEAAASVDASQAPFTTGVFIALIVATVIIPLVGMIVGGINLGKPHRKKQSQILLAIGIGIVVLYVLASA